MKHAANINKYLLFSIASLALLISARLVFAMDSTSYSIDADSINFVGGDSGASSSYLLNDTGGEVATGDSASSTYELGSGYRSSDSYRIALSCPASVVFGSVIGTGKSELDTNDVECTVITDNPSGYDFLFDAETTYLENADGDRVDAYSPSVPGTPEAWNVASSDSEWGVRLKKNGTTTYDALRWGAASVGDSYENNDAYWHNVTQNGGFLVVTKPTGTDFSGDKEVLRFGAEIGAEKFQPTGTYTTKVYITAISL